MKPARWFVLLCLLAVNPSASLSAEEFLVRDGDRVVFLGDSITEQRLYTTYIEAYALTRFPGYKLWFRNVGWGGDTSWLRQRARPDERALFAAEPDEQQRMVTDAVGRGLARDVLPLRPTFVTVKFGMNDHSYQPFREDIFRAYVCSQTEIARVLKENGARVAFLTPQPIEEKRSDPDKDPRNESLRKFSDGLRDVAARTSSAFVDQFDPFMTILLRERAGNPPAFVGGGDAVHPGPVGQTLMAWAVLKGMHASPLVSSVRIDAAAKAIEARQCRVESLEVAGSTVRFSRADFALPMPIDPRADGALKLAPVIDELNRYELCVTGLPAGDYELTIDGEAAGTYDAGALAKGVNLALQAGPVTAQAQRVLDLVFKKNNVYFTRWRGVQLFDFPAWSRTVDVEQARSRELARLDQEIADLETQIDAARQPKPRRFELVPAGR